MKNTEKATKYATGNNRIINGKKFRKCVIINRAVPGSGKTSITRNIINALEKEGLSCSCHSTDDFFMIDGKYCFDKTKLQRYHQANQKNFFRDLADGLDVVICDNTNILPWQSAPYTVAARKYGYHIMFLNLTPRTLSEHIRSQIVTPQKPDAHGVPEAVLINFINDFHTYNDLFDKTQPVNPETQFHYFWDAQNLQPQKIGIATHFDADAVLTFHPADYRQVKENAGKIILEQISSLSA